MTLSALFKRGLWTRVKDRRRHVYDLRFEWRGEQPVCTHLVLGGRGLLERLDLRPRAPTLVSCGEDLEVRDGEVLRHPRAPGN
jgi:hypothetical protein